jgi:hypothetical protein
MTPIDHAAIYDFANEHLKQTDKSKSVIKALAENIFNTYFKENFNSQTINLQGHLRAVVDNRPMTDFENQRLWRDLKDRYLSVIESYLLDPLVKGIHKKKEIVPFFKKGESNPHWIEEIHCVDCGCNLKVKKKGDTYTNDLKENEEEYWVYVKEAQSACKFPEGVGHYSNVINVPSGKLIFSNYLLNLFDRELAITSDEYISDKCGYRNSINSDYGVKLNTEFWNNLKVIYIQVGNTSPTLYQNPKTHEITCKMDKSKKDSIKKGKIDTTVWAVFGMDYDEFIKLCKENGKNTENIDDLEALEAHYKPVYIDVPAGKYEVTSYNAAKYDDQDTFFTIKAV